VCQKLAKLKMMATSNPGTLFEKMQVILNSVANNSVSDEDLIAMVLEKAPANYAQVMTMTQLKYGDALTLTNLEKAMKTHYRTIGGGNDSDDDGTEVGVAAPITK